MKSKFELKNEFNFKDSLTLFYNNKVLVSWTPTDLFYANPYEIITYKVKSTKEEAKKNIEDLNLICLK